MVTKVICLNPSAAAAAGSASSKDANPLNPLSEKIRSTLYSEIRHAIADASVTSVILFGGGPHFSAGADIT